MCLPVGSPCNKNATQKRICSQEEKLNQEQLAFGLRLVFNKNKKKLDNHKKASELMLRRKVEREKGPSQ